MIAAAPGKVERVEVAHDERPCMGMGAGQGMMPAGWGLAWPRLTEMGVAPLVRLATAASQTRRMSYLNGLPLACTTLWAKGL